MKRIILFFVLAILIHSVNGYAMYVPNHHCETSMAQTFPSADLIDFARLEKSKDGFSNNHKKNKKTRISLIQKIKFKLIKRFVKIKDEEGKDERKFHWASVAALICGVLTLISGITFLPAIVFGVIGIIKSGPNKKYKGLGMAIVGLGLGLLIVLIFALYLALVLILI